MAERTVIHLTPIYDGWAVKFDGTKSVVSAHTSRADAVRAATELAQSVTPSVVQVHSEDGAVESETVFDEGTA